MNVAKVINLSRLSNVRIINGICFYSTKPVGKESQESGPLKSSPTPEIRKPVLPPNYRFVYPEFLPDPKVQWRNSIREKLERKDMLDRRMQIGIPEFYVGSILAVTSSDRHAAGKVSKFVGLCIDRVGCGLRSRFVLRNIIDHQGIEICYEMYDPTIQKIDVIKLEKRLDDKLYFLRDALPEYSTFDVNMEPEILSEGSSVPVNDIIVKMKPRPWSQRWERHHLKGVENIDQHITDKMIKQRENLETPWEKYDLMKEYRRTIPEEEQNEIYAEVYSQLHQLELARKKLKRKRTFVKPTKLG